MKEQTIKLTFVGDIMALLPQNKVSYNTETKRYNYDPIFEKIAPILKSADYVIGNLETPIAGEELKYTFHPSVFNTPIEFAEAVKKAGVNFVSTANNHCLDRGIQGLFNTIDNLNRVNLDFSGTYKTNEDGTKIFIKQIGGVKIAIVAYTYGTNSEWQNNELPLDKCFIVDLFRKQDKYVYRGIDYLRPIKKVAKLLLPRSLQEKLRPVIIEDCVVTKHPDDNIYLSRMVEKINIAKEKADIVVMYMHTGGQFNSQIGQYTQELTDFLSKQKLDLIIGSHPHCVLKHSFIDHKFTALSLGNFCYTPKYGNYHDGVFSDYSIVINTYIGVESKRITDISYFITKVIKDDTGNHIIYHIKDLYDISNEKERNKLQIDCNKVATRFFDDTKHVYDVNKLETYI